ncbi:DUF2982 domain-containing protein [Vibrio genomosp. F10 str. 9ZC157]|uniref:DUF2982 domain-containing protein n=1 Tax=Vibrio genomosp. F10 str. ZF-129 TaxID=1187848 RepID=A0A1E5BAJ5_9VIBR|nr:DUF2982 domain-containing protein [Vibrio genomosp. F10]OEE30935.1 hypothetical protein A1QO_14725 [Vibrio genomosp. F10 str. ZF-129]OEE93191.1 hypothetical protein A1QM_10175 [Vibrio genomosp. F10 str. 9ZC157]
MKMQSQHLSNHNLDNTLASFRPAFIVVTMVYLILIYWFLSVKIATIMVITTLIIAITSYALIQRSKVSYTLTATHFQQHLHKGGWVVRWSDIEKIDLCHIEKSGLQIPLPWIGIKLRHYSPYLDSICPRIASEILLSQRALLYTGLRNMQDKRDSSIGNKPFEDLVLDSSPHTTQSGKQYDGLRAMLGNRMAHQRAALGFDIFISTNDLDRDEGSFVGLTRRYLAAAEPNILD